MGKKKLGVAMCTFIPVTSGKVWNNRRIMVQASLGKQQDFISKITRGKKGGGMAPSGRPPAS
jgi:hypothetical protein